jgi:hypothetical protein
MGAEAICGSVGCLVQPVDGLLAGVELSVPSNSAGPSTVWLLPGTYGPGTPTIASINGSTILSAFLGGALNQASANKGTGFELYASATTAGAIQVGLAQDVGVAVYTDANFRGTPQLGTVGATNGQGGGRSVVLANNTFALFAVSGSSNASAQPLQVWDGLADSFNLGLGQITLQPTAVQPGALMSPASRAN